MSYGYEPLDSVVESFELALRKGDENFRYVEYFGPSKTSFLSVGWNEDENYYAAKVFVEVPVPHSIIEFDAEGIFVLLEEYRRGILALKALEEDIVGVLIIGELRDRFEFHGDMIDSDDVSLESGDDLREVVLTVRKSIGLAEPLTFHARGIEGLVFRRLVYDIAGDLKLLVYGSYTGEWSEIGVRSLRQLAEETNLSMKEVEAATDALLEEGLVVRRGEGYAALMGTGALLEALSGLPPDVSCLLWPYALGFKHKEWRIFYKTDKDIGCIDMSRQLVSLEARGFEPPGFRRLFEIT